MGGLGGTQFGVGGAERKTSISSSHTQQLSEADDDEGMEMN